MSPTTFKQEFATYEQASTMKSKTGVPASQVDLDELHDPQNAQDKNFVSGHGQETSRTPAHPEINSNQYKGTDGRQSPTPDQMSQEELEKNAGKAQQLEHRLEPSPTMQNRLNPAPTPSAAPTPSPAGAGKA